MQSLQIAVESRETGSVKSANAVRVLEQSVDQLEGEMREKHIRRLSKGKCDPESGVIFLDIISNLERISDHAVNIADYVKSESEAGIRRSGSKADVARGGVFMTIECSQRHSIVAWRVRMKM